MRELFKRWGRRLASHPYLHAMAARAFDDLVAMQIRAAHAIDRVLRPRRGSADLSHLTLVIKTFERRASLLRMIASIRRVYPEVAVVVVDDSHAALPVAGVDYVKLPFDSGVSAGRNAGLARVTTPFVMILDDDFIFYRRTDLARALAQIERNPRIDILGGAVITLPALEFNDSSRTAIRTPDGDRPLTERIDGLQRRHKVPNFFIARTERLRLVGWDDRLKRLDHLDFFTRASGLLCTVFDPGLRCLHAKTPFDRNYMQFRLAFDADVALLQQRYPGYQIKSASARQDNPEVDAEQLLGLLLASRWHPPAAARIETLASKVQLAAWRRCLGRHQVAGELGTGFPELIARLPAPLATLVRAGRQHNQLRALRLSAGLVRVMRAFEHEAIPVLPLKGPVLSMRLYGNSCVRQSCDLDILVDPADLYRAVDALKALGFQPRFELPQRPLHLRQVQRSMHHLGFADAGQLSLELHWRTDPVPATSLPRLRELWPRLERIGDGALTGAPILPFAEQLRSLSSHACRSRGLRWKWGYDIAGLLSQQHGGQSPWSPEIFNAQDRPTRHVLAQMAREWGIDLPPRTLRIPVGVDLTRAAARIERAERSAPTRSRNLLQGAILHAAVFVAQPSMQARLGYLNWIWSRMPVQPGPLYTVAARLPLLVPLIRLWIAATLRLPGRPAPADAQTRSGS